MEIQISKLEAARRQLTTAVKLFFTGGDIVSIHTLAFASFNVTRNICDQHPNHPQSFSTLIKKLIN